MQEKKCAFVILGASIHLTMSVWIGKLCFSPLLLNVYEPYHSRHKEACLMLLLFFTFFKISFLDKTRQDLY